MFSFDKDSASNQSVLNLNGTTLPADQQQALALELTTRFAEFVGLNDGDEVEFTTVLDGVQPGTKFKLTKDGSQDANHPNLRFELVTPPVTVAATAPVTVPVNAPVTAPVNTPATVPPGQNSQPATAQTAPTSVRSVFGAGLQQLSQQVQAQVGNGSPPQAPVSQPPVGQPVTGQTVTGQTVTGQTAGQQSPQRRSPSKRDSQLTHLSKKVKDELVWHVLTHPSYAVDRIADVCVAVCIDMGYEGNAAHLRTYVRSRIDSSLGENEATKTSALLEQLRIAGVPQYASRPTRAAVQPAVAPTTQTADAPVHTVSQVPIWVVVPAILAGIIGNVVAIHLIALRFFPDFPELMMCTCVAPILVCGVIVAVEILLSHRATYSAFGFVVVAMLLAIAAFVLAKIVVGAVVFSILLAVLCVGSAVFAAINSKS